MNLLNSILHEMLAMTCFVRTIIKTVSNDAETIRPYYECSNMVSSFSCYKNVKLLSRNWVYFLLDSKYRRFYDFNNSASSLSVISSSIILEAGCSQISIWKLWQLLESSIFLIFFTKTFLLRNTADSYYLSESVKVSISSLHFGFNLKD
jgi:cellulose synthase/poly-beta-1,6-N-acetylglucosamine synthase-like glycosyltransferase